MTDESLDLLVRMHAEEISLAPRIAAVLPDVARIAGAIATRMLSGRRWFSIGAGTSGRLCVLDAAELPPTFGTDPRDVVALIAGGPAALLEALEGAEDDRDAAERDLRAAGIEAGDVVLGVAASGATPYVAGGLRFARAFGAFTVAFSCRRDAAISALAECALEVDTGPEVLSGSTRLKAGSAQKQVLNMLSTAVMNARGLIVRGEMAAMRPTNAKLRDRAERIVRDLTGVDPATARTLLERSGWHLPTSLVCARHRVSVEQARSHLARHRGSVRAALEQDPR
ncbi:MAG: N-acetylmuramic acid 6-phosphate etherase [Planctomycetes bacterium]|nr:N-acetylmuramic acid 6-phosphate etherase [Planctomycetota bacterium]